MASDTTNKRSRPNRDDDHLGDDGVPMADDAAVEGRSVQLAKLISFGGGVAARSVKGMARGRSTVCP